MPLATTKNKVTLDSTITAFEIGKVVGLNIYRKNDPDVFVEASPAFIQDLPRNPVGYCLIFKSGAMTYLEKADFEDQYEQFSLAQE